MTTQTVGNSARLIFNMINNKSSVIKTFGRHDEPWFCGNDIAKILGYKRPRKSVADSTHKIII
jgi:prophage antirepressor-like protein